MLYEAGQKIRHVYFPGNSLVSLLMVVTHRMALEVGMVGREGMVGVALALGRRCRRFARWCRERERPCEWSPRAFAGKSVAARSCSKAFTATRMR